MFVAAVAAFTVFPGCANLSGESHTRRATSLMQYLFPGQPARTQQPAVPTLTLPLRIGVAFVPEGKAEDRGARGSHDRLPEAFKAELAKEVSSHFRELAFVQAIELIPTAYLQPGGGFANLEQIRQVFGVDVVALLSFDQSQTTDEGFWSITYWTLVGAYVVPAEKNLTATLLDAAVFDVASRKLLFRAPGISRVPGRATVMNLTEELREDSQEGFRVASTNLVVNLKTELAAFQERVKQRPDDVKIVRAPGYRSGAGTMGWGETGLLALVAALVFLGRKTGAAA
jgi:rhombotail lipoprotein